MTSMHCTFAATAALSLSLVGVIHAEEKPELGAVVVTAERIEQPITKALASVTVLTRADIIDSHAADLLDLLARQAGLDLVRTGGPGSVNTLFTRGSNSKHTLVLIDGVRVNTSVQGAFDFAHLPLAQIERIEIVRGPRAAYWGSDAIGGVLQIFTRDPEAAYVDVGVGSYGHTALDVGLAAGHDDLHLGFAAGREHTTGFSATDDFSDKDGYDNRYGSARLVNQFGDQHVSATMRASNARSEFDEGISDVQGRSLSADLQGNINDRWSHQIVLGAVTDDNHTASIYGASFFRGKRASLDWLNAIDLGKHTNMQIGINYSHASGQAGDDYNGQYFDQSQRNLGEFIAWNGQFGDHRLQLTQRHDDNSQFGGTTNASAAWGWQASQNVRVRASWGQGFRAPSLNDLYFPNIYGCCQGNPDLRPESSVSRELGLDWQLSARQTLGLSAYRSKIADLIELDANYVQYININRAKIHGVELEYHGTRNAWSLDGNATWQGAVDALTDQPLLRRPQRKLNVDVAYRFGNASRLALETSVVGPRPDFGPTLPGYARLDLGLSLPLTSTLALDVRLENLTDRDYHLVNGYNTPGRSGQINLRWEAGKQP